MLPLAQECQFFARAVYHIQARGGSPHEVAPPPETRTGRNMLADLERAHVTGGDVADLAKVYGVEL